MDTREAPAQGHATAPDERRMQVRAYNHWASLLGACNIPSVMALDPEALPEFGPCSVLLDLTGGERRIVWLGERLAQGGAGPLAEVPAGSLLGQLVARCDQMLASHAPLGFESAFVDPRGRTVLCRGILLPFSSDDARIDFIYGVISWTERAGDAARGDARSPSPAGERAPRRDDPLTAWADGPLAEAPAAPAYTAPPAAPAPLPAETARRLRALPPRRWDELAGEGEFALLLARRGADGTLVPLAEAGDEALLARAAAAVLG